jgi:hypothetical protein
MDIHAHLWQQQNNRKKILILPESEEVSIFVVF